MPIFSDAAVAAVCWVRPTDVMLAVFALLSLLATVCAATATTEHTLLLRKQFRSCTDKFPEHISAWSQTELSECLKLCQLSDQVSQTLTIHSIDGDGFLSMADEHWLNMSVSRVDVVRLRLMVRMTIRVCV